MEDEENPYTHNIDDVEIPNDLDFNIDQLSSNKIIDHELWAQNDYNNLSENNASNVDPSVRWYTSSGRLIRSP